jgi:hypothetical protein
MADRDGAVVAIVRALLALSTALSLAIQARVTSAASDSRAAGEALSTYQSLS